VLDDPGGGFAYNMEFGKGHGLSLRRFDPNYRP
jgi:hypothetical protein